MIVYPEQKIIKYVLKEVKEALDNVCEYNAKRKKYLNENARKIKGGSFEEHLCTLFLELGNSYASTTQMI